MQEQRFRFRNIKKVFFFFFILWTGILFWFIINRYHTVKEIEKELIDQFAKRNVSNIGALRAVEKNGENLVFHLPNGGASIGDFAEKTDEEIEETEKISILSENSITNKQEMNQAYFEKADSIMGEEQKDIEKESTETSNIILFNNGMSDITSENKQVVDKERSISDTPADDSPTELEENRKKIGKLTKTLSRSYLLKNFYITDSSTSINNKVFQVKKLLTMDMRLKKEKSPQILIIHTHGASEAFIDSKKNKEDSIIGVGTRLAEILSKQYGYQVIHDKTEYDKINGSIDRNKAYNMSYAGTKKILEKYPSIEIVIDLHRDGVGNKVKRTTIVDGKRTAQVMFFNGLSRSSSGNIDYLKNPNLQGNLSFSLQLELACMRHYKNFVKTIYLKGYRYNMHLKKRYTLIELGNENNTVAEAKNAAAPLALAIHEVLTK